jgi:hypothetical protein
VISPNRLGASRRSLHARFFDPPSAPILRLKSPPILDDATGVDLRLPVEDHPRTPIAAVGVTIVYERLLASPITNRHVPCARLRTIVPAFQEWHSMLRCLPQC